ncbi:hypothetical protein [Oceaniglobus ichthyenteri]|uniref:hypothetical protein n=1 Tax=Oceaniglobus ichthyenteri TaxID=2136177 RepID=UPI000D3629F2|nr:hypothetical protein [Oceaniglobus ichthyenteri]
MTTLFALFLILQGGVFLLWAVLAFRWLFAMRAEAVARSGRAFPGFSTQIAVFRKGLSHARYHRQRVRLIWLSAILFALSVVAPFVRSI